MSTDQQRNLPVRLAEVVSVADQVLQFLRNLDGSEVHTAQDGHAALGVMDEMARTAQALLFRGTTERNRLRRQIAEAELTERELTAQAASAARRDTASAKAGARAALTTAHRLRADLAAWRAELPEAEEVVVQAQDLSTILAQSRADLDRIVQSLERGYRRAEIRTAMTRLAEWMQSIDRRVRVELAGHVRQAQAEAEARYTAAVEHGDMQILRLRADNLAHEVDEELERLRRGDG